MSEEYWEKMAEVHGIAGSDEDDAEFEEEREAYIATWEDRGER